MACNSAQIIRRSPSAPDAPPAVYFRISHLCEWRTHARSVHFKKNACTFQAYAASQSMAVGFQERLSPGNNRKGERHSSGFLQFAPECNCLLCHRKKIRKNKFVSQDFPGTPSIGCSRDSKSWRISFNVLRPKNLSASVAVISSAPNCEDSRALMVVRP